MVRFLMRLAAVACSTAILTGCASARGITPFDPEKIVLLQFEEMNPGEEIAVVETSAGQFTLRFFPSEAPATVERFLELVKEGRLDGKQVEPAYLDNSLENAQSVPESDMAAGVVVGKNSLPWKQEISYNLGPFPGAVSLYLPQDKDQVGFLIFGSRQVPQTVLDQLEEANYPADVIEKFETCGGYPEFWLNSSIFAQVIDGMDTVDSILQKLSAQEPIEIRTVTLSNYTDPNADEAGQASSDTGSELSVEPSSLPAAG